MYIDFFKRHLAVASRDEAARMLRTDRKFWNVISICSPTTPPLSLSDALPPIVLHYPSAEETKELFDLFGLSALAIEVGRKLDPSSHDWRKGGMRTLECLAAELLVLKHAPKGVLPDEALL